MRLAVCVATLAASLLAAAPARAMCSIQLQGVAFGVIDVTRREESTGSVRVSCDRPQGFNVEIGGSLTAGQRRMHAASGGSLRYELYADAAHTHVWGDGMTIGAPIGGASNGSKAEVFTIYGVIPPQPGTLPGTYVDAPLVTLSF